MATVIDSLVVSLGLDASKFTEGQKNMAAALKKMEEASATTNKKVEAGTKQLMQAFSKFRNELLALTGAFIGATAIKGFVKDITLGDAAVGRLSKNVGMSAASLKAWETVAEQFGATAGDVDASFRTIQKSVEEYQQTGHLDQGTAGFFARARIDVNKYFAAATTADERTKMLAQGIGRMNQQDAQFWGQRAGFTESTINMYMEMGGDIDNIIARQKKLSDLNELDAKKAAERAAAWARIGSILEGIGRHIMTDLGPIIDAVTAGIERFLLFAQEHGDATEVIFMGIAGALSAISVIAFGATISGIVSLAAGLGGVAAAGGSAAAALGTVLTAVGGIAAAAAAGGFVGHLINKGFEAATGNSIGSSIYDAFHGGGASADSATIGGRIGRPGSSAASTGAAPQSDVDALIKMGWTREQAIGIAANLQRESSGNAGAVGDNGSAYGLAQWHPDRQANFKKWAGKDIRQSTREEQLAFVNYELTQGSERRAGSALRGATSAGEAGALVSRLYERPANVAGEAQMRSAMATRMASSSSTDVKIGQITVVTQATDANGIARDLNAAIKRQALTSQANGGAG